MPTRSRSIVRETGTALAVLAIYVLTLLLPLHQAAGLQRDLARIGYETIGVWSICTPLVQDEHGHDKAPVAVKCPAAGVAKTQFSVVLPPAPEIARQDHAVALHYAGLQTFAHEALPEHFGQSRAPPVPV